jgi:hypothetical protein
MPKLLLNDPAHWRRRAEEARRIADHLDDPVAKQKMLEVAQHYEQIAAIAERQPVVGKPEWDPPV